MNINVDGLRERGRPKKRWIDCVKNGMNETEEKASSDIMTVDRTEW